MGTDKPPRKAVNCVFISLSLFFVNLSKGYVCLNCRLFIYLLCCLYICLAVFLLFCLTIFQYICLSHNLTAYLSIYLSVFLPFCPSVYLSLCLYLAIFFLAVCLSGNYLCVHIAFCLYLSDCLTIFTCGWQQLCLSLSKGYNKLESVFLSSEDNYLSIYLSVSVYFYLWMTTTLSKPEQGVQQIRKCLPIQWGQLSVYLSICLCLFLPVDDNNFV